MDFTPDPGHLGDPLQLFVRIAAAIACGQPGSAEFFARTLGDLRCSGNSQRIDPTTQRLDRLSR
ncbi:MAG TPA: hypothetical protein VIJ18_18840 [Microbacteriaceae bacterium]